MPAFKTLIAALALWTTVAHGAPRTAENAAWNVNFNSDGSDPSRYFGEWPGHSYFPSPGDWREIGVYQFVTDRFRDGDPSNNEGKYGGYNLYDIGARHGGDFIGVKESLPYIKSLGYDAIWISPIFQNRYNSYHGYAQIDFTVLDDRFGTLQDFRAMVDEAHRLGMYVIVDIVVNHMDNLFYFSGHERNEAPFRFHLGEYDLVPRNPGETYADFWVNNTYTPFGQYSDVYDDGGNRRVDPGGGSYWDSDFHHNGDLQDYGDPWSNHLGKIYGSMDDLRTSHPRVQDKIIAMTKALISSTDIDGIRMDTPMQVPLYFFKRWVPAVKDHARKLGKSNFFAFAEFYCNRERAATMVGRGKTRDQWDNPYAFIPGDATFDGGINYNFYFKFIWPAIKFQQGGVANAMNEFREDLRAYDLYNPARGASNYVMLNFLNNHDQWRMNWEPEGFQKTLLASSIIAFWPGVPLFYYGDEQGFASVGSALDGRSREDFMTSKAWFDVETRSPVRPNPVTFDNFNMTHSHYLFVQKMMNVRKQYFSLRTTDETYERWHQVHGSNGIFAFSRVWGEQKNWVFVAFNTWRDRLEAGGPHGPLYTGWNEGDWLVNALNPEERVQLGHNGTIPSLWLNGYETKVFVRADNLQPLNPVVNHVSPEHDAVVDGGSQVVRIGFSEPMNWESLKEAVTYDSNPIASSRLRFADDKKSVQFDVAVSPGIHKVKVSGRASALTGKPLLGDFQSRFRSGGSENPIIRLQKDFLSDDSLATVRHDGADNGSGVLSLNHKADGAAKFRVSVDFGKSWTRWQDYSPHTEMPLSKPDASDGRTPEAWVQYWVDGSAAYFVRGRIP